ncbi:hypothetical protein SNEBB_007173 [Seison nebaliae]|nr:hypothetical protein SNEBB_007173 [Seison nebaliae]
MTLNSLTNGLIKKHSKQRLSSFAWKFFNTIPRQVIDENEFTTRTKEKTLEENKTRKTKSNFFAQFNEDDCLKCGIGWRNEVEKSTTAIRRVQCRFCGASMSVSSATRLCHHILRCRNSSKTCKDLFKLIKTDKLVKFNKDNPTHRRSISNFDHNDVTITGQTNDNEIYDERLSMSDCHDIISIIDEFLKENERIYHIPDNEIRMLLENRSTLQKRISRMNSSEEQENLKKKIENFVSNKFIQNLVEKNISNKIPPLADNDHSMDGNVTEEINVETDDDNWGYGYKSSSCFHEPYLRLLEELKIDVNKLSFEQHKFIEQY